MAEARLNFNEAGIDKKSGLYDLYNRFYEGMRLASLTEAPDYVMNPPLTKDGEIDAAAISRGLADHSTTLMKNSAYMMASSIMSTISGDGNGGAAGIGFLSRDGDKMAGHLASLYGFQAGHAGKVTLEVGPKADGIPFVRVRGELTVDQDVAVSGKLHVDGEGLFFSGQKSLSYVNGKLTFDIGEAVFMRDVSVGGKIKVEGVTIDGNGIFHGANEYYHKGNSNNKDCDWSSRDIHAFRSLVVGAQGSFGGTLSALRGFELGMDGEKLFYLTDKGGSPLRMAADLSIEGSHSIKFGDTTIIKTRGGVNGVVSFSAPDMVMNLGDSDNGTSTKRIVLQTDIHNHSSDYVIVSRFGDGNFRNSLTAGCANAGPTVLRTYHKNADDCGVAFSRKIRLGAEDGPALYADDAHAALSISIPYIYMDGKARRTAQLPVSLSYRQTTSLLADKSLPWSASLLLDTQAEFFTFGKPVEGTSFSIVGDRHKTRLIENTLFLDDGKFLEGVADGIRHAGSAYFDGNIGSARFAEGFAGYGWAIRQNRLHGGVAATFDEITVRRKMRIYELEVQKQSVTNGSLWVSDACSGDMVEEIA
jgi:hypothetical protein